MDKHVFHRENFESLDCPELQDLLTSCFGRENARIERTDEELCRIILEDEGCYVAHGAGYMRQMSVGDYRFMAGIVGGVCVRPEFRRRGLALSIVTELNATFRERGAGHAFLFAYETAVYTGCGYRILKNEMHVFDTATDRWQIWAWNGSMYANLGDADLPQGTLEFNGCNY